MGVDDGCFVISVVGTVEFMEEGDEETDGEDVGDMSGQLSHVPRQISEMSNWGRQK